MLRGIVEVHDKVSQYSIDSVRYIVFFTLAHCSTHALIWAVTDPWQMAQGMAALTDPKTVIISPGDKF